MGKKKTGWALSCRKLNGVAVKDLRIDGISSHSVSVSVLARKHSAYSESDRRPGAIAEAPRVRGGLEFAKRGPISGDFRPFSTVFRQNGAQNYFRFRLSFQIRIPRGRLYWKRRTYRYRILANFWDTGGQSPIMGRFYGFSPKWRLKLLPFPVFSSDSNSSSSTLLGTTKLP